MVRRCYVKGCGYSFKSGGTISFHSLPLSKPDLLEKWMQFLGYSKDALQNKKSVTICSNHFNENDYRQYTNNKVLLPDAVPSMQSCKVASSKLLPNDKKDVNRLCRFCGIYNESDLMDIFNNDDELLLKLNKYIPAIPVLVNDGLPSKICKQCTLIINSFANFHSKAEQTQAALKRMLNVVEITLEKKAPICQDNDVKPIVVKQADVTFDNSKLRIEQEIIDLDRTAMEIKQEPPPKAVPPKPSIKLKMVQNRIAQKFNDVKTKFAMENGYFRCLLCEKMKFVSKKALNNHIKYTCIVPIKEAKVS